MSSVADEPENPFKPWHIALFVIAVLAIAWLVFGMVRDALPQKVTEVRTEETRGRFAPGSQRARMDAEK